jgi:probable phosphoglycerate mutase
MTLAARLPRRRIYLFRHGDVTYFDRANMSLPIEQVPLSQVGRQQIQAQAELLATIPLDKAIISPLLRCQQTAEILLAHHNLTPEVAPDLEEIRPGSIREIDPSQIEQAFLDAFDASIGPDSAFLSGESFGQFLARILPAFDHLLTDTSWNHLLVVAHGGVNRAILTRALGSGLAGFSHIEQDAGCLNILDVDARGHQLVRLLNYTSYNRLKHGQTLTTMEQLFEDFKALFA